MDVEKKVVEEGTLPRTAQGVQAEQGSDDEATQPYDPFEEETDDEVAEAFAQEGHGRCSDGCSRCGPPCCSPR